MEIATRSTLTLTPHQQTACDALVAFASGKPGAFVLTGSAGTGKTTLLRTACALFSSAGHTVGLMAPTGRAARVLSRRTGLTARTIHNYLYTPEPLPDRPGVRLVRKGLFADTYDILVVDEASLVSARRGRDETFVAPAALLDDLLAEAERTDAHVVFVGDPCQLPPVYEETSVALRADLLTTAYGLCTAQAHLSEVMRHAEGSDVLAAATALRDRIEGRNGFVPALPCIRWPQQAVSAYLDAVANARYDQATMLAFMNRSVHELNARVRERLGLTGLLMEGDLVVTERDGLSAGVLVPRAETYVVERVTPVPELAGLQFADVRLRPVAEGGGVVDAFVLLDVLADEKCALTHEQEMTLFAALSQRNPGYPRSIEARNDPYVGALRLRYGHALTVHKAQGGEWPQVFLDTFVPNTVDADTALRWKYTALTRASDSITLMGRSVL